MPSPTCLMQARKLKEKQIKTLKTHLRIQKISQLKSLIINSPSLWNKKIPLQMFTSVIVVFYTSPKKKKKKRLGVESPFMGGTSLS